MKTITKNIIVIILGVLFASCTEVVDVDVPEAQPRLVIEASLDWEKGTQGNVQTVNLSLSTPYFDNQTLNPVENAFVSVVRDVTGDEYIFHHQGEGVYLTTIFEPVINESYTLTVEYNGEIYSATETLRPVVDLEDVYQSLDKGSDEDILEVNIDFNDPASDENFYFIKLQAQDNLLPVMFDLSDEFVDGNLISLYYERVEDEEIDQTEFEPGDVINIEFYGISEQYYNYIGLLISQYESLGDLFSTIPVELRGNCINESVPDNYAYGYFRLTEVVNTSYTFQ